MQDHDRHSHPILRYVRKDYYPYVVLPQPIALLLRGPDLPPCPLEPEPPQMPARPLEPEPPQMPERPTERKLPGPDCFAVQGGLSVALQLASQPRASRLVY
ncbi:hypothetical protein ACVWWY_002807, partial [Thermostichus sp. OS-CIW-38]